METFPKHELKLLRALEPGAKPTVAELVASTGLDQSLVMAAAKVLSERGLVLITEKSYEVFKLADDGPEAHWHGLPEKAALEKIRDHGGSVSFQELPKLLGRKEVRAEVKWLTKKGWVDRDANGLTVSEKGKEALGGIGQDEEFLAKLPEGGEWKKASDLEGVDLEAALALLKGRTDVFRRKRRVTRTLSLTDKGAALKDADIRLDTGIISQLTSEYITSDRSMSPDVLFKKYDVTLDTAAVYPGKVHPLQRVIQETRRAFLEMGFEEARSPAVDTSFWVFDALFQPQDHPAREMQDTFYVSNPERGRLPDEKLVQRIAATHEDGGDTGSTGWRYKWSKRVAERLVLRTHTTAATIRELARDPNPPRKVFSIGRTFRRENVDQTHLAEFIQIDGIIIDEQADLASLFGILNEFYRKMGAEEVRFRPSFFPYTEPSVEVFAKLGDLGWVEMCGAGVFRPEVTLPLGCKVPVLAWGGGVERIAMMRFGLDDIRKLYLSDIDWLKGSALCR